MKIDLAPYANQTLCVALSGGEDSMALLHYLIANAQAYGMRLCAAHLEHGIRGERSRHDADFVSAYCQQNNIPLYLRSENCVAYAKTHKMGLEEGARAVRYRFFADILHEGKADGIATAHHAEDNAETVLMNLFRGSALTGAGGIAARQGKIVRPMLAVDKTEITAYLRENGIPCVEDETNADTEFTRNRIRAEVLPAIKRIYPAGTQRIYAFSRLAREDDEYLYAQAREACTAEENIFSFSADLARPLFLRACVLAFRHFGGAKDYTQQNCEDIFALRRLQNGACVHLPFGLLAAREYDRIAVYRPQERAECTYNFGVGAYSFGGNRLVIAAGECAGGLRIDGDKLPAGCVIRTRRTGDSFEKFGGGRKKLKDYLIDRKIPVRLRDGLPLIAKGSEVYAVCGVEISEQVKTDCDSSRIYTIILHKGEQ